jgi:hypothetical protein
MTLETSGTGIILALTNAVPGREMEFNKWYDDVHVNDLVAVPGIGAAQRYQVAAAKDLPASPYDYLTIYRTDVPLDQVFTSMAATRGQRMISDALAPGAGLWAFQPIGPRVTA